MSKYKKIKSGVKEVAGFAAGGGAVGLGIAAHVGRMGLAVAGGGVGIGAAPVAAAGVITGLAAYGLKRVFKG